MALVISRKRGEGIHAILPDGSRIVLKFKNINSSRSSVVIEAPKGVRIVRDELDQDAYKVERAAS